MTATMLEQPVTVPTVTEPQITSPPLVASTDKKALLDSLTILVAALPTRPPMQVLLGIKISADGGGVHLAAFDFELSVSDTIAGSGSGEALVPGRLLSDIVKSLDPGPVQLDTSGSKVQLTQGDLTYALPTLPVEDYPALPNAESATLAASLSGNDLKHLNRVSLAASRDQTLLILTGVRLEFSPDGTTAAATDRYRLAVSTLPVRAEVDEAVMVPARTLAFITKHLGGEDRIELLLTPERHLVARSRTLQITTRLLEGEFPRYRSLIPAQPDFVAVSTLVAAELTKATKQVALVAARNAPVRLTLGESNSIKAGGADDAQAEKKISGVFTGAEEIGIAFNPAYLLDGIDAVAGKKGQVLVEMTSPTRPAVLTDVEDTERAYLYLLMPVRLSG